VISLDIHDRNCNCSYCGNGHDKGLHYGLNIPPDWKAWNSWWVIKFWPKRYFRWTNSFLRSASTRNTQK
jgi:hypothetical protein